MNAALATGLDDAWNAGCRGSNDRELNWSVDLFQRLVRWLSLDDIARRIYRVNLTLEVRVQQILEDNAADRVFSIAGTKEGDAPGGKQGGKIVGVHDRSCGRLSIMAMTFLH